MSHIEFFCFSFIFINILSFSIQDFNNCEPVQINPKEFDFTPIIKGLQFTMPKVQNNKIIQAFDYQDLDNIFQQYGNTMEGFITKAKLNEKNKLKSDVIFSVIEKTANLLGFKSENETEIKKFYDNAELDADKIQDKELSIRMKNKIKEEKKEYKESINTIYSDSNIQKTIGGAFSTLVGGGLSFAAKYSIISPQTAIIILGVSVAVSGAEKVWNWFWGYDADTLKQSYNFRKFVGMLDKLNKLMYNYKWVDNNVILTAYSTEEECYQSDVRFHYVKEIIPKNTHGEEIDEDYYKNMALYTCLLKKGKNECEDIDECVENLLYYNECKIKKRGKEAKSCSIFTINCKLRERKMISINN